MKTAKLWAGMAVLVMAGSLAGCSGVEGRNERSTAPSSTTQVTPSTTTSGPQQEPPTSGANAEDHPATLRWRNCDGPYECADLKVPLDYQDPTGETLSIAVVRASKAKPSQRIGSLLLNPGGPGASGIEFAEALPLDDQLTDRFDIIGFDPRGAGRSSPVECHSHLQAIYDADPILDSAASKAHFLRVSQDFVDECNDKYAKVLPHLGTRNVARDMDRIRQALGDDQLNYLGFSYGTSIGQQYARLFPTRVRTMVLDGVVDPSVTGLQAAKIQAEGFEDALRAFASWCDKDRCLPDPALTVIDRLQAKTGPIAAPGADRPATRGVLDLAMASALYSEVLWDSLADALDDAIDSDGTKLVELADRYLGRHSDGSYDNSFEIYFGVSCIDSVWPKDPEAIFAAARSVTATAAHMGPALINDYLRCALWPVAPDPLEPIPSDIKALAPILLVSTTGDPATPHKNAVAVAKAIPGARLITFRGEGHTVYASGVSCVDEPVNKYLVTAKVPGHDLTC